MGRSLFITGARGFIGRRLLARLNPRNYDQVYCLSRADNKNHTTTNALGLTWLEGSLFDADNYSCYLNSDVTVVHLAAVTGKAAADQYFAVNREGTKYLLARCRERRVTKFLYVSSIAAKYPDKSNYYYAQSKLQAEEFVRNSDLCHVIVRPTIVLGRECSGWQLLSRLARLAWMPVVGDGSTQIQPIEVDDLVDAIMTVIEENDFHNETFDLGGPEILSIEEFLVRVHRLYYQCDPRVVHLPYRPLRRTLCLAEAYFSSILPLNAGQLSLFVHDGTIAANRVYARHRPRMKGIDAVLQLLVG